MAAMVRIQADSYDKLNQLARQSGMTIPEILDAAIEEFYCKRFFDECDAAYNRLKQTKEAWRREMMERAAWEVTLSDGLRNV